LVKTPSARHCPSYNLLRENIYIAAIALIILCVGLHLSADGQEVPTKADSAPDIEADTSRIVIIQPQEEAKPQSKKDRMLTEEEAYDLVWNLPEVKKEIERILEQGGVPFSTASVRPSPDDRPEEGKSVYAIRFQGIHAKDVLVDLLFYVDAFTGQVLFYDSSAGSPISLDDWRRRKK
jgi:hypothetical protein